MPPSRPPHPLLKTGSLHAGLIRGGQELTSYPASCVLGLERRTLPGETVVARTVGNKVTVSIHYPDNTESEVLHLEDSGWHVSK